MSQEACPSPEELELTLLYSESLSLRQRRAIQRHVADCPKCLHAIGEMNDLLKRLHAMTPVDPGADFTERIVARAQRPLRDRLWHPDWMPFPRALSWSLAALTVLAVIIIFNWPDGVGHDRVTAMLPPTVAAGAPCTVPVYVTTPDGEPIRNGQVTVKSRGQRLFSGRTDAAGLCLAVVKTPDFENYTSLDIDVSTPSGAHEITLFTESVQRETLHLSTDKPLYQPGQTVHLRLLCVERISTRPAAGREVVLSISDPRGNLLFERKLKTSSWGIASADFPLDREAATGDYTVEAKCGDNTATRTLTVSHYTLPKFKVVLTTGKGWFKPGETIAGSVDARYFFGKPCAGATVRLQGVAPAGLGDETFATASGVTDAQGHWNFRLPLPEKLFGSPARRGNAVVSVKATIIDAGGHLQEISRQYPVSKQALLISVLPESGAPIVGVHNDFYVVTSYPDGNPAKTTVTLTQPVWQTITTDAQGIGTFSYRPEEGEVNIELTARDVSGATGVYAEWLTSIGAKLGQSGDAVDFDTEEPLFHAPDILLRTDKAVYQAGDTARLSVLASKHHGLIFLEVTRDKQPVLARMAILSGGRTQIDLPLGQDMGGLLTINAYMPGAAMEEDYGYRRNMKVLAAQGSRSILVKPAETLKIAFDGLKTARPGETQQATLRVTDRQGRGVPAAVGLAGVDEAVFALENQYPGLSRMFFLMQQELDDPMVEVHDADLPAHLRLDETPPAENAARVALAAVDSQPLLMLDKFDSYSAMGQRYDISERRGRFVFGLVITVIWLLSIITIISTAMKREAENNPGALAGWVSLTFVALLFAVPMLLNSDTVVLGILLTLIFWGIATLYRMAQNINIISVLILVGLVILLSSLLFPTFAKAREKARQSSAYSERRMLEYALEGARQEMGREKTSPAAAVRVREYFPETLAWMPEIVTDEKGEAKVTLPAADSITTWRLSLLANTRDGRLGSADIPYKVFQDFFVDADVPVQLTVGDTFSLPVAVHNYAKERQTIALTLDAREGLEAESKVSASLTLEPDGVGKVLFPLRAVEAGRGQITVKAVGGRLSDAVRRHIDVVPQGRRVEVADNATLRSNATLNLQIPAGADLKTTDLSLRFYPGPVSQALAGLDGMLQKPYGCFEQTTSTAYPNLMILRYLRESGSKDVKTLAQAQTLVSLGYQRLLTFEVKGGGFSLYGEAPAEFALTGLGLAQFQDIAEVQAVDGKLLARTADWLVKHWNEADPVSRSFAALPLARAGKDDLANAWISKRGTESGLSAYELALLANAAARTNHALAPALTNALAKQVKSGAQGASWSASPTRIGVETWMGYNEVETTALAVQAFAKAGGRGDLVRKGVDFLVARRSPDGGWSSTQDTVQALRALMEASASAQTGTVEITVNGKAVPDVTLAGDGAVKSMALKPYLRQGKNTVQLRAKEGCSPTCQLAARYYTTAPPATRGANPVTVSYDKTQLKTGDIVTATVRVAVPRPIDMAMVDLSVPPGFLPLREDLDALKDAGNIERYDVTGTQIILYLRKLTGPAAFRYRLRALFPVSATVRPSSVYPYYQPAERYMSGEGKVRVL
ncbi:MAG: MG2 domain-containing protein [Armatimonadota bacterium]